MTRLALCGGLGKVWHTLGLYHVLLLVILALYSFLGGLVFIRLEKDFDQQEIKVKHDRRVNHDVDICNKCMNYRHVDFQVILATNQNLLRPHLREAFFAYLSNTTGLTPLQFIDQIEHMVQAYGRMFTPQQIISAEVNDTNYPESGWNWKGSTLFASTLYTTIGYGQLIPQTHLGRAFAIIYSIIGIPLCFFIVTDIGKLLFKCLRRVVRFFRRFGQCCCGCLQQLCPCLRKVEEEYTKAYDTLHGTSIDSKDYVPLFSVVVLIVAWLVAASAIMMFLERNAAKWSFYESFWFVFISLSTIGLGDYFPTTPNNALISVAIILSGMALLGLCFNIYQLNIERMYNQVTVIIDDDFRNQNETPSVIMPFRGRKLAKKEAKQGLKALLAKQPLSTKLLVMAMDSARVKRLQDHLSNRNEQKFAGCRAAPKHKETACQTGERPVKKRPATADESKPEADKERKADFDTEDEDDLGHPDTHHDIMPDIIEPPPAYDLSKMITTQAPPKKSYIYNAGY